MRSQFVATSTAQFIRKVAIDYVRFGYVRYALRSIPDHRNPWAIDEKLRYCYDITTDTKKRTRRRQKGLGNVVFVRLGHRFVLLATEGEHQAFNRLVSHKIQKTPFCFEQYSISIGGNSTPVVTVRRPVWKAVKHRFKLIGLHDHQEVQRKFDKLPFAAFPGVIRQKRKLGQAINNRRKVAGLPLLVLPRFTQKPTRNPSTSPEGLFYE